MFVFIEERFTQTFKQLISKAFLKQDDSRHFNWSRTNAKLTNILKMFKK